MAGLRLARLRGEAHERFRVSVRTVRIRGEDAGIAAAALRFAGELQDRFGIGVHRVDERLTSREAEDELRERRRSGAKTRRVRRGDVDREAARLLLLQWLRARPSDAGP